MGEKGSVYEVQLSGPLEESLPLSPEGRQDFWHVHHTSSTVRLDHSVVDSQEGTSATRPIAGECWCQWCVVASVVCGGVSGVWWCQRCVVLSVVCGGDDVRGGDIGSVGGGNNGVVVVVWVLVVI